MNEQIAAIAARIEHANTMSETHIWSKVPASDRTIRIGAAWSGAKAATIWAVETRSRSFARRVRNVVRGRQIVR